MRREGLAGLLSALLCTSTAGADADEALERLLDELDAIRVEANVAGLGLILVDGDHVTWCGGMGLANRETGVAMANDTMVRIGSVTKVFTGLALLAAQQEGVLDLDAPVASLVEDPPFHNPWAEQHPVTVAQLLEHSAGLRDMSRREFDFNEPVSLKKALAVDPDSRRLAWRPGLHSSYSNSGAGVAAYIFEQVSERDFERYVAASVFKPLGMTSATFRPPESDVPAAGYDTDGVTPIKYWHQLYRPFGAINVRLKEMAPLVRMLIGRGRLGERRIFSEAQVRRLETPRTTLAARGGLDFGYGFGNYAYVRDGFVFHGHGGDADGYLSFYGYNLETRRGYFLLINAFQGRTLSRMRSHIERYLVRDVEPVYADPTPQPEEHLKALTGTFRQVTHRFGNRGRTVEVVYAGGRLWLKRGDRREALLPMSRWHFRRRYEPVATTALVLADGALHLQGPFGNFVRD